VEHLDEGVLAALLEGTASEADRRVIDEHVDTCSLCKLVLVEMARAMFDTVGSGASSAPVAAEAEHPPVRYQRHGFLGRGGMGEVLAMRDTQLDRVVALKRLRPDRASAAAIRHLLEEGRLTAQLEHPNIIPVHDIGVSEDLGPFFTMKRVEGTTLDRILAAVASGAPEAETHPPMRLMIIFLQIVQAMAYAHASGVVHCDLKPSNVMIGRHGEVLVTDWGLARTVERAAAPDRAPIKVAGTPQFMSPEQVEGKPLDARSDIYALGALLYQMLTLKPLREGDTPQAILAQVLTRPVVPPRVRAPERDIPLDVEAICLRALERDPAARFESAEELRVAIEAHLNGTRRRKNAQEQHALGEQARARWVALRERRGQLEAAKKKLAALIKPYDDETKKQPLWRLEEELDQNLRAIEQALADALDSYSRAVGIDADFRPSRARLAELQLFLYLEAEQAGDRRAELLHRRQLERYDNGLYAEFLSGRGSVSIAPTAPGASITAHHLVERGSRIEIGERLALPDPQRIESLSLPIGSYLFRIEAPGCRELRLNVGVERNSDTRLAPRSFSEQEIGAGLLQVPAGPFLYGGDRLALNSAPREVLELDDFAIARFAVTCEEYLEFLNALLAESPHLVQQVVPRTKPDGGYLWEAGADGRYFLPRLDGDGNPCHPRAPVMGVSFVDAEMYTNWRAKRDGVPYRLPTEEEWEKAARGADGRAFPWGNGFDPTFCKMALSRPGRPQPEPVGSFPIDCSIYGMRDAAGTIREWCSSFYDEAHETRVLRGGAWYFNPSYCRLAFRHGYLPHIVFTNFGFRLCRSL
jgi:serine/threonine-protein kinase